MKTTLNTHDITNALFNDKHAAWSYNGAKALAEYLEQYEEDCGIDLELDVVALRCEFSEFASLIGWAEEHFANFSEEFGIDYINPVTGENEDQSVQDCDGYFHDETLDSIGEYIRDRGQLIEFEGGIIVSEF
jgi:hypothetical protein